MKLFVNIAFIIVTIFILIRTIFYSLYEINANKNKSGGIAILIFSIFVVIFSNIIMFLR